MRWITTRIKGIMLLAGVLTGTMLHAAIDPQAALQSTFGERLEGPAADIVVRNWGVLIGLVGAMLIYGAYNPPSRSLVLTVAAVSKVVFIGLVLTSGTQYMAHQAGIAVIVDAVFVFLFVGYLVTAARV